jgi:hypothetical protein
MGGKMPMEYYQERYQKNKVAISKRNAENYAANPDKYLSRPNLAAYCAKYQRTLKGQFRSSKGKAKQRNVPWLLTFEEFAALRSLPCDYCGGILPDTSCGLDQKTAGAGYSADNVVPCCTSCNTCKMDMFSYDEFKKVGEVFRTLACAELLKQNSGTFGEGI